MHSPNHLFILPGALMALLGVLVSALVLAHVDVLGRQWDLHALIAGALLMIVGTQVVALGLCAHAYGTYFMNERDPWFDRMRGRYRLEHGLLLGGAIVLAGLAIGVGIAADWVSRGFGSLGRGAPRDLRADARDRRHSGLLLVVPAEHPRPAPRRRLTHRA